jgi:hypothetical protein
MANEMVQTIPGAEGRGGIRGDITGSGTGVLLLEKSGVYRSYTLRHK